MRYVIIRDDDTNAFTPPEYLERLYRPFLERGLPVNLAVIPDVAADTMRTDGLPEGFLMKRNGHRQELPQEANCFNGVASSPSYPIARNEKLVRYLLEEPGYSIVQHGCHHDQLEFDRPARSEVARRLEWGTQRLLEAGFARPQTFVAPYDKLSQAALVETASRFRVLSTGWFELRRLPYGWWPRYALKKMRRADHWQIGRTLLLTHPGCLLSYHRDYTAMPGVIANHIKTHQLTVLVTHWWEYFHDGTPDEAFIHVLHETADYLGRCPDLKVISFAALVDGEGAF
jgi:Uncharacterized protein conserved in bacteria (DUF2334)